jgi:NAD(P) transhydrogenase subunit alpha
VLKEPVGENRVSIVPNSYKKLNKLGFEVSVESGAGEISHHSDNEYQSAGFIVSDKNSVLDSDIVVSISMPDISKARDGQIFVCVSDPFRNPISIKQAIEKKITLISMDMIPRRLSRAQAMDVNSSQDNLAGYKAVLLGAANVCYHGFRSRWTSGNSHSKETWSSCLRFRCKKIRRRTD